MKNRSRDITIRLINNHVVYHDCPSKYLFLTARLGIAEAANRLGITTASIYHHLRKNNESELVGIRQRNKGKQMYTDGGWFSSIPNLKEELRQAKLKKVSQAELAKHYSVSVGTIRNAIKEFGLLPWVYAPKH